MIKLKLDLRPYYPAQTQAEYEPGARLKINAKKVAGEAVHLLVKVYEDEADKYSFDVIERHILARGAKSVQIYICKYPRKEIANNGKEADQKAER